MAKALLVDLYELTMAQVYFKYKPEAQATFDLFIRSPKRPFYVACGIDEALSYLSELRFTREDIDYLRSLALFEDSFLDYLREFRFCGEVWGVEEPEIIFAQEPILRVTGNLIQTQIVESALLNKINLATTLATKASRVVIAAKGKGVYDFGLRRTQGEEASLAAAKYSYMVGAKGTSNVKAGFLYKIPVVGTMAHSFTMSFEREIESFLAFAYQFPAKAILLVDTYDVKKGIDSAIRVAKFLKRKGVDLLGIRLDSGDLASDAKYARKALDTEGLIDTFVFASGNLDEYKIDQLIEKKAPIDAFGVGTNMGCSSDLPFSDVIYKLVEIKDRGKNFIPTMKLSTHKTTLPSKKQIFRTFDAKHKFHMDYIGLADEKIKGVKLLTKLLKNGKRLYKEKTLEEKKKLFLDKVKSLPATLTKPSTTSTYPVKVSKKVSKIISSLRDQIQKRISPKIIFMDIDVQHDFVHKKGALYVKGSEKLIPNLKKLTDFAKKHNILTLSSQDSHRSDDPEFKEFGPHCVRGSWGHKKIKETKSPKCKTLTSKKIYSPAELLEIAHSYNQIIYEKEVLNVFSNPNAVALLEVIFPDMVYVYGLVTEYCVKEAVEGLSKLGFAVTVVSDAIKEISHKEKQRLFSLWKRKGVKLITTNRLLSSLK